MSKQTVVDFLLSQLKEYVDEFSFYVEDHYVIKVPKSDMVEIKSKAREIERKQRIKDYTVGHQDGLCNHINDAENYVNESYYTNGE